MDDEAARADDGWLATERLAAEVGVAGEQPGDRREQARLADAARTDQRGHGLQPDFHARQAAQSPHRNRRKSCLSHGAHLMTPGRRHDRGLDSAAVFQSNERRNSERRSLERRRVAPISAVISDQRYRNPVPSDRDLRQSRSRAHETQVIRRRRRCRRHRAQKCRVLVRSGAGCCRCEQATRFVPISHPQSTASPSPSESQHSQRHRTTYLPGRTYPTLED